MSHFHTIGSRNTLQTNTRRRWQNVSQLSESRQIYCIEMGFDGFSWSWLSYRIYYVAYCEGCTFVDMNIIEDFERPVAVSAVCVWVLDDGLYTWVNPPVAPPATLAAPRACSFSPTFFCTSLNFATHLSMHTLSPLSKSGSAYRWLMHLA